MFFCIPSIFCACIGNNRYDGELLRLHIRANSNSDIDQSVKLAVRDAVNEYIENNIHKSSFDEAYREIGARLNVLDEIASGVLTRHGFTYGAKSYLSNEYFPTRTYGDTTVQEGYYDALIIELGKAEGDNWWCVIYPPLCYGDNGKFEYKSFFAELFS
ncbi:MAG: stage II sporulation protein R [Clostridiales bacterium]|nr:stage II sporulation protein R [Clostridiales bacterium]